MCISLLGVSLWLVLSYVSATLILVGLTWLIDRPDASETRRKVANLVPALLAILGGMGMNEVAWRLRPAPPSPRETVEFIDLRNAVNPRTNAIFVVLPFVQGAREEYTWTHRGQPRLRIHAVGDSLPRLVNGSFCQGIRRAAFVLPDSLVANKRVRATPTVQMPDSLMPERWPLQHLLPTFFLPDSTYPGWAFHVRRGAEGNATLESWLPLSFRERSELVVPILLSGWVGVVLVHAVIVGGLTWIVLRSMRRFPKRFHAPVRRIVLGFILGMIARTVVFVWSDRIAQERAFDLGPPVFTRVDKSVLFDVPLQRGTDKEHRWGVSGTPVLGINTEVAGTGNHQNCYGAFTGRNYARAVFLLPDSIAIGPLLTVKPQVQEGSLRLHKYALPSAVPAFFFPHDTETSWHIRLAEIDGTICATWWDEDTRSVE